MKKSITKTTITTANQALDSLMAIHKFAVKHKNADITNAVLRTAMPFAVPCSSCGSPARVVTPVNDGIEIGCSGLRCQHPYDVLAEWPVSAVKAWNRNNASADREKHRIAKEEAEHAASV